MPPAVPADGDPALYVGLISGTSLDGIDAALVSFADSSGTARPSRAGFSTGPALQCELLLGRTYRWDDALRARLLALGQGLDAISLDELGTLDAQVAQAFAAAALQLLDEAGIAATQVAALGSHGQTVRHRPHGAAHDGNHPFTWQLGDGNLIAERCGIVTVADFRRRDVAAGGHGAPLLPALHGALLRAADEDRAVLNLGGIANLTLLPRGEDAYPAGVRGFDTGPANALLDAWCERHLGHAFDAGGAFAASGEVDAALLARLLDEPWFALPPPKSSGREQFHLDWLASRLRGDQSANDVQATLLELTAVSIADALRVQQPQTQRVIVCGGGVHNPLLLQRIADRLPGIAVESSARYGLDPDFVEAIGFAWLARETLAGRPGNLPGVTGARGPRILGAIYPA